MTRRTVILDTETTGLDATRHEVWEVAVIELGDKGELSAEHVWRMVPDLTRADPGALQVNRYYERTGGMILHSDPDTVCDFAGRRSANPYWSSRPKLAPVLARLLDDATIVAANPTFDAGFLAVFLGAHGEAPTWHYRLRDIGSMAYGWSRMRGLPPREIPALDASTDDFARALRVDPDKFQRHSALGDCRLLAAMFKAITGGAS
jgi:DNA polymerase III epsilon subunit-like protein